ncbi:MAG TPA: nucleotidyltransferase family protein [Eoetvoesiella sp.]
MSSENTASCSSAVAVLILAAGTGSRFDPTGRRFKLLQNLADGRTVIRAVAESALRITDDVWVVCGEREHEIAAALAGLNIRIVSCSNAAAGMGASLKCGVQAARPRAGWLVMLGDMPYILHSTAMAVYQQILEGAALARPYFDGKGGHPAGISGKFENAVLELKDSQGGAAVFLAHADQVKRIGTVDPGCLQDIDYPEDLIPVS